VAIKFVRLKNRRGLRANLPQPLAEGEIGVALDTREVFVGVGNQSGLASKVQVKNFPDAQNNVQSIIDGNLLFFKLRNIVVLDGDGVNQDSDTLTGKQILSNTSTLAVTTTDKATGVKLTNPYRVVGVNDVAGKDSFTSEFYSVTKFVFGKPTKLIPDDSGANGFTVTQHNANQNFTIALNSAPEAGSKIIIVPWTLSEVATDIVNRIAQTSQADTGYLWNRDTGTNSVSLKFGDTSGYSGKGQLTGIIGGSTIPGGAPAFQAGNTVTGGTSGATGIVESIEPQTATTGDTVTITVTSSIQFSQGGINETVTNTTTGLATISNAVFTPLAEDRNRLFVDFTTGVGFVDYGSGASTLYSDEWSSMLKTQPTGIDSIEAMSRPSGNASFNPAQGDTFGSLLGYPGSLNLRGGSTPNVIVDSGLTIDLDTPTQASDMVQFVGNVKGTKEFAFVKSNALIFTEDTLPAASTNVLLTELNEATITKGTNNVTVVSEDITESNVLYVDYSAHQGQTGGSTEKVRAGRLVIVTTSLGVAKIRDDYVEAGPTATTLTFNTPSVTSGKIVVTANNTSDASTGEDISVKYKVSRWISYNL
tara:strand:- start:2028 stop:3797 length:1770 start_codon:yes stop_codon:yes gene_type:complete